MGGHETNQVDKARDELFSHIRACQVLEAEPDEREAWFDDTLEYMAGRYPDLSGSDIQVLRTIGLRYCAPVIPHGRARAAD